jgi:FAD/FMN-containing dehydrogenase
MQWIQPADAAYDETRALFNVMIDKRPALIARCSSPRDVRAALERSRAEGLALAVRAGGHSVAGMSTNDDGLVIDVRPMKEITIDPAARRARVGAGVTWGELDAAAHEHGLVVTGGRASTTGVTGFTIGGGSGWIERRFGLASDNLVGIDLVTVDGREVHADETANRDLLWAHRGGGGNFGVVTALEFTLHPVAPLLVAGLMAWQGAAAPEVGRAFRDWAYDAPVDLGTGLVMISAPPEEPFPEHLQLQPIVGLAIVWTGDEDTGNDVVAEMRGLSPDIDLVDLMPYPAFNSMLDDPPGMRHYWSAEYHDHLDDPALDVFLKYGDSRPVPTIQHAMIPWGGAVAEATSETTPMAQRSAHWVTHPYANWVEPADDEACIQWVKDYRRDMAPYASGGVYLNFIGDEGQDRIAAAFGPENYARLRQIKAEYDPENLLRGNQNIVPATR